MVVIQLPPSIPPRKDTFNRPHTRTPARQDARTNRRRDEQSNERTEAEGDLGNRDHHPDEGKR